MYSWASAKDDVNAPGYMKSDDLLSSLCTSLGGVQVDHGAIEDAERLRRIYIVYLLAIV